MRKIDKIAEKFNDRSKKSLADHVIKQYEKILSDKIEPDTRFLQHGKLDLEAIDVETRQVSIKVCIPFCVLQSLTPLMAHNGLMDKLVVQNPINVWSPVISKSDIKDNIELNETGLIYANKSIQENIKSMISLFADVIQLVKSPDMILPLLPIGVYVEFRYRSDVDRLASLVLSLEDVPNMTQIQIAFTSVMVYSLYKFELMTASKSK